jgi:hypothetical protein
MGKVKDYCQSGLVLANRKLYSFENIDDAIELYTRLNLQPNFNE